ncbi:cytidine deaminase family protein [Sinomicrobium weinanense]|uniref:Cytidine deaminase n=1 Tax=Sinomicrobium weinanense TaxID=2842200 RepID=A0A926JTT8_9FLAO|nr:cytidine deaminase [Sinomicrobium weinanense]MBC9797254.1 cytidine deaminase [Sinomicrobium weinanense]MBU3122344.1 cytidine deaminase [Sinomicrobium weinanense]
MITRNLKEFARQYAKSIVLNDFVAYGGVATAIETIDGNIYTGISIDTACSMGFCAEHSAVAEMLKHGEHHIKNIVAVDHAGNAVPPCGRCRELMSQLSKDNLHAVVEVKNNLFKPLKELLPFDWKEDLERKW